MVSKRKRVERKVDPPVSGRAAVLARLTKSVGDFKLWSDVEAPMVLRTRITSLNRALKIGGVCAQMLGILHGPSQGGKTLLVSEVLRAIEETGGLGLFVDAECRGVDLKWFEAICGSLPEIVYYKPKTFEEFVNRVQEFRTIFRKAKIAEELPPGAMIGIGIDSLNRLAPEDELAEISKKGKVEGRRYPLRAMMISAWLDVLIPTLERDEVVVGVLREGENIGALPGQETFKIKGGKAPIYDAGWVCRVTARGKVKIRKSKDFDVVIGEKHEVSVRKNSMGTKDKPIAHFYSSIGVEDSAPIGLDVAREVREEAIERGIAKELERKETGKGYYVDGEKVAKDKPSFLSWLQEKVDGRPRFEAIARRLDADFD